MDERPLNPNQTLFVEYLLAEEKLDASKAYASAYGVGVKAAQVGASKLMKDPRIKALVDEHRKRRAERLGLKADDLLLELRNIVTADARDLSEYHRGACRYCYGEGFLYHRTPAEYRRDVAQYQSTHEKSDPGALNFPVEGGVGFNPTRSPNPECPECFGKGEGYSHFKDSRKLTPAAARIFAGVKATKDGLEVKVRSQDRALELYMRHLGMLKENDRDPAGTAEEKAAAVRALVEAAGATIGGPGK